MTSIFRLKFNNLAPLTVKIKIQIHHFAIYYGKQTLKGVLFSNEKMSCRHTKSPFDTLRRLKNSNHLRSHLRAIMFLDHSRLGLENKFWENKSGRIFCVRQVYFTKSCLQIWGRVNQPFILFIHHIWDKTVLWGVVCTIQTSDRMRYFTILQYKLHSFKIQDDRSTSGRNR